MADLKISQLTGATTPLAGTEVLPIVQSGVTRQISVANLTTGRAVGMAGGSFTDNITQSTAAKGVNFTANTPAAGMTSQLLNWYEEGTWTPSLGGSATYTTQLGRYTRVGRSVTINGYMKVNVLGSGSAFLITGLPFTSANDSVGASVSFSIWKNLATTPVFLSGYIYPNFAGIEIQGITAGSANTAALSVLTNASEVYFSSTYFV